MKNVILDMKCYFFLHMPAQLSDNFFYLHIKLYNNKYGTTAIICIREIPNLKKNGIYVKYYM